MTLVPYTYGYYYPNQYYRQSQWPTNRFPDQELRLALAPDDLLAVVTAPAVSQDYYRPWRQLATTMTRDIGSNIKSDKDKVLINLDVQYFTPEEISVKTTDGFIVVEAKHEEKQNAHGYVTRQLIRRYTLPEGIVVERIESRLSSDGVLTIIAPKTVPATAKNERAVPITQTGPVRQKVTEKKESIEEKK